MLKASKPALGFVALVDYFSSFLLLISCPAFLLLYIGELIGTGKRDGYVYAY
jgi:hypothetical protein